MTHPKHGYAIGQIVPASYRIGSDSYGGRAVILSERRLHFMFNGPESSGGTTFSLRKDGSWREVAAKSRCGRVTLGESVDYMDPHF